MDRICLIKMNYQSEEEEQQIVRLRTECEDFDIISIAVKIARKTREHPDVKLGASVRAAIDLVDIFASLQKLSDQPEQHFLIAAPMALSNKIWLNEITSKTPEGIIDDIWSDLRADLDKLLGHDEDERTGSLLRRKVYEKGLDKNKRRKREGKEENYVKKNSFSTR